MTLDLLIVIPNRGEGKLTIEELENLRIERANTNSCYIPPGETLLKPPLGLTRTLLVIEKEMIPPRPASLETEPLE